MYTCIIYKTNSLQELHEKEQALLLKRNAQLAFIKELRAGRKAAVQQLTHGNIYLFIYVYMCMCVYRECIAVVDGWACVGSCGRGLQGGGAAAHARYGRGGGNVCCVVLAGFCDYHHHSPPTHLPTPTTHEPIRITPPPPFPSYIYYAGERPEEVADQLEQQIHDGHFELPAEEQVGLLRCRLASRASCLCVASVDRFGVGFVVSVFSILPNITITHLTQPTKLGYLF